MEQAPSYDLSDEKFDNRVLGRTWINNIRLRHTICRMKNLTTKMSEISMFCPKSDVEFTHKNLIINYLRLWHSTCTIFSIFHYPLQSMLSNYFKLAVRNLLKNRLYSFINIAGLSVGLAAGILVLLWVTDELGYDKFHANLPNIHRILQNQSQGGVIHTFSATPGPLAAALRTEYPEIQYAARASWTNEQLIVKDDKNTYERGIYAEPDFFKIFTFPAIAGDPIAALQEPGSVIITERTAKKFFGDENPLGKTLRHNNLHDLKVAAVLRNLPANSSLKFDVVLPFRIFELENAGWIDTWGNNALPTYIALHPNTNVAALNKKLESLLLQKQNNANAHLFAYPVEKWRLYSKFSNGQPDGGRITSVILLGIIGIFILLIGCINFMNLATARSERRAREVGVRKTMGAQRSLIIGQFLSEAMLMTFLALGLSLLLARLALPAFNLFFEKSLTLSLSNWQIWAILPLLGLLTGLIAGSYPAFFLSGFQPVRVLKGVFANGTAGAGLRKGLVTFQFIISILLIISTIVIYRQLDFAQNLPIGYDAENLISIPIRGDMKSKFEVMKQDLTQIPGVSHVAGSKENLIECGSNTSSIEWPGKTDDQNFLVSLSWVTHDWIKTSGMKLAEGRDFSPEYGGDTLSCLLNRTAVKRMGLKEPVIGTIIRQDTTYSVIGVVEDFAFNDPLSPVAPMVIYFQPLYLDFLFVRFQNNEHWQSSLAQVEKVMKKHNPDYPFEMQFVKEAYQENFDQIRQSAQLANVFGGLAIFISCLGLFGLSAFVAEQRKKEIGIRKILGATVGNIWAFLSRDFLKPVLLAFLLASPLAMYAMQKLLSQFEYHIDLSWWMFAAAGGTALLIAIITVSFQGVKAALTNPVRSLRSE